MNLVIRMLYYNARSTNHQDILIEIFVVSLSLFTQSPEQQMVQTYRCCFVQNIFLPLFTKTVSLDATHSES
jgi:hypothetical protein